MDNGKSYARLDEHGVYRVGQTRVMLDSVLIPFRGGQSAESIQQQYPALELEEVYGAITFYLANRQVLDEYLERQDQLWEEFRRKADENPSPVVERLRKLRFAAELFLPSRGSSQRDIKLAQQRYQHRRYREAEGASYDQERH